jgi:hypothetical protein
MNSSNNNILFALVGLSACALAVQNYTRSNEVKEHFAGLTSNTFKPIKQRVAVVKGDMFEVPGNYQSSLSPRFSNVDYGANIRYNMPSANNLAVNKNNPLTYGDMIFKSGQIGGQDACTVEGYCNGSCGAVGCRKGGGGAPVMKTSNLVPSSFAENNYKQQVGQLEYNKVTDMLPVQSMSNCAPANALGQAQTQPIVYDRIIYANQRSRLYAAGDPIRGDLPIVPVQSDWFRPSVHPQIDLRNGAIAAMSGLDSSTTKEVLALQNAASVGLIDTGSGINYAVQKSSYAGAGGSDVQITAFP